MALFNLGTGEGTSVLQLIRSFEAAAGRPIAYEVVARRPGDVPRLVADISAVQAAWGWTPEYDLTAMCEDAWRFVLSNPGGYSP